MKFKKTLNLILVYQIFLAPVAVHANNVSNSEEITVTISTQNSIELRLSTNLIDFTEYNGTRDFVETFDITINSSLDYLINTKLDQDLASVTDPNRKININNIFIYELDAEEKFFEDLDSYIPLVENGVAGKDRIHKINIKLKGDSSVTVDEYRTKLTFEAVQK